jgi:hypothetical protein
MPNRTLSPEVREQLATSGAAMSQMPSGIPRKRYFTPDGREEWKVPQYRIRQGGEVYDIFLDDGYSLTKPEHPKPYCAGCDRWHDTQEEVDNCIKEKKKREKVWERKARAELKKTQVEKDKKIAELEKKIDKLTKLMEEHGKVL